MYTLVAAVTHYPGTSWVNITGVGFVSSVLYLCRYLFWEYSCKFLGSGVRATGLNMFPDRSRRQYGHRKDVINIS